MDMCSVIRVRTGHAFLFRSGQFLNFCAESEGEKKSIKLRSPRIRVSEQFHISADDILDAVRKQQLEGVVGKRSDSLYEVGQRSGAWVKMRINKGQEFVIGGFFPGPHVYARTEPVRPVPPTTWASARGAAGANALPWWSDRGGRIFVSSDRRSAG